MKKPSTMPTIFLSMSLALFSTKILAQEIPKPSEPYGCLTRAQQEKIAVCFDQNESCHKQLAAAPSDPVQDNWGVLITAVAIGIISGMILNNQLRN